jgi:hypothetical protein
MSALGKHEGSDFGEAEGSSIFQPSRGKARRFLVPLLFAVGLSGGALALYHRPSGRGFWAGTNSDRLSLHVQVERLLVWGHRAAALILVLVAALWVYRKWRRYGWQGTIGPVGWLVVALSATMTAFFVPWEQFLPWSDVVTVAQLEPTRLGEAEGPFPELIALRSHYPNGAADLAWPEALRSRRGSVLAWVHVLVGPLGALAALFVRRMNRVRHGKDT